MSRSPISSAIVTNLEALHACLQGTTISFSLSKSQPMSSTARVKGDDVEVAGGRSEDDTALMASSIVTSWKPTMYACKAQLQRSRCQSHQCFQQWQCPSSS